MAVIEAEPTSQEKVGISDKRAAKLARYALAQEAFAEAQAAGAARKAVYDTAYNILHPGESHPVNPIVRVVLKNEEVVTGRVTGMSDQLDGTPLSAISVSAIVDLNTVIINDGQEFPIREIERIDVGPTLIN